MKLSLLAITLAAAAATSDAIRIPVKQTRRTPLPKRSGFGTVSVSKPSTALSKYKVLASGSSADDDDGVDLSTVHDLIYMANVVPADYTVQLDTGSSDLWIKGSSSPLPNTTETSTTYNLTYGIGWAYGHISYASAEFAGISIPKQAFLDVSQANNPALSYGADGILGLGFTSLSTIDALVNGTGASTGRSILYNAFLDNPSEPNFIAFALQRSTDNSTDDVEGMFSIGEVEEGYEDVNKSVALPTWPVAYPKRWNVLLEAVIVGNTTLSVSTTVSGAPSNRAVALLDSGTSYTYAPTDIVQAIYGSIKGASYDSSLGQWVVPCNQEIDMALQFGHYADCHTNSGVVYPLHPLDITPTSPTDSSKCVGSFVPSGVSVGAGEFDWLMGDSTLRSMYSVYDFGDFDSSGYMGNPYVKLLSVVDPDEASKDFAAARGTTARTGITYNASNSTANSASTTISISTDVADIIDKLGKYLPAMAAVMALNALVLLVLCIAVVVYLCRRRSSRGGVSRFSRKRANPGRMSPMPMGPPSHPDAFTPPDTHNYEPVSMAISEDTMFSPPSPGYGKYDGDTLKGFARPKSSALSMDRPYSMASTSAAPRPNSMAPSMARPYSMMPSTSNNPFTGHPGGAPSAPLSPLGGVPVVAPQPITSPLSGPSERPPSAQSIRGRPSTGSIATQGTTDTVPPLPGTTTASSSTAQLLRPSHLRNVSTSSEFLPPKARFQESDLGERPKSFAN
ncbi:acid protease [Punctularia strigosozonata HHB-11173 SS5]|uniref:acid protease n=1 Tax=Punctularia strigosozonata (strain HHB-11173) TaxID=741275 RepID=UPI0004418059|nr:acid protease [Punctularia strigosozonata HHB-11173 SS5]EIN10744.1 acid protease [Punctularia strigosozonata HHB-11173 SS5]